MSQKLMLIEPSTSYKKVFQEMVEEIKKLGEENFDLYKGALDNFENYVGMLQDHAKGINLPQNWVPCYTYWLIDECGNLLGVVRIRTQLGNEYLEKIAGHIGYDISPLFRNRGYGKKLLRFTLEHAKKLKINSLIVTSDTDNIASIKIIESNGGSFETEILDESTQIFVRRYWFYF